MINNSLRCYKIRQNGKAVADTIKEQFTIFCQGGNKGDYIFKVDRDKEYFIDMLKKGLKKYKIELYAYCIMGNHYHFLLSIPDGEISKFMHFVGLN